PEDAEPARLRLFADGALAATLAAADDLDALSATEPWQADLVIAWLEAHRRRIGRHDQILVDAVAHEVPDVRRWGLARLDEVGIDTVVALRLLESGMPDAWAAAQQWCEALSTETE